MNRQSKEMKIPSKTKISKDTKCNTNPIIKMKQLKSNSVPFFSERDHGIGSAGSVEFARHFSHIELPWIDIRYRSLFSHFLFELEVLIEDQE